MEQQIIANGGVQYVPQIAVQYVYLDFDGELTSYNGKILTVDNVEVQDSSLTEERIACIVAELNEKYASQNVIFVTERPESVEYSTIYIGKTNAFDEYGSFAGLAETIDEGNQIKNDNAFVMLDFTATDAEIISTISHETDHLLGTLDHGGEGIKKYAEVLYVNAGNIISSTVIDSGNTLRIVSGGTAIYTTITAGCRFYVSSGGVAENTIVSSGFGYISNGAVADTLTLHSGWVDVFSGGEINNATISGGSLYVSRSGNANNIILAGGFTYIYSSAIVNSLTINSGYAYVYSSAIVNSLTINSGYAYIYSSATINNLAVNKGSVYILGGASVTDISANSNTYFTIGIASGTYIQGTSAGKKLLISGAEISGHIVDYWQRLHISNGGKIDDVQVKSGGYLYVSSGGSATNIVAEQSGYLRLTVAPDTYIQGSYNGSAFEIKDATLENYSVHRGGYLYVSSGGTVNNISVDLYGGLYVYSGGSAANVTISSGGYARVTVAPNTYIQGTNNGSAFLVSDGKLDGFSFGYGQYLNVLSGGTASNISLINSASAGIYSGTIDSIKINSQGRLYVSRGGSASDVTVNSGGSAYIYSSGTINNVVVNYSGTMNISSGGIVNSAVVHSSAFINVQRSATLNNVQINSRGKVNVSGIIDNATVNYRGYITVFSGAMATNLNLASGAYLEFDVASNTLLQGTYNNSAFEMKDAYISGYTVLGGNSVNVQNKGSALNTTVSSGILRVNSGGTVDQTNLSYYGTLHVSHSGKAANTSLGYYGYLNVSSGGEATSTVIDSYGSMYIASGGVAKEVIINKTGVLSMYGSEAAASGVVINSGGNMYVSSGASANNIYISSGGYCGCARTGIARNVTVENGGRLNNFSYLSGSPALNFYRIDSWGAYTNENLTGVTYSGNLYVASGILSDIHCSGGVLQLAPQVTAENIELIGGYLYASSGTVVSNITLTRNGSISLWAEKVLSGLTLNSASYSISSGKTVDNAVINDQGKLYISSRGNLASAQINSGGQMEVLRYGSASVVTINNGGEVKLISSSGILSDCTVSSGGILTVSNGSGTGLKMLAEAKLNLHLTSLTSLSGSNQNGEFSVSNGIAQNVIIASGGFFTLSSGCKAENITFATGASYNLDVFGNDGTTAISGFNESGTFSIKDGVANDFIVDSGARLYLNTGASAINTKVKSGGNFNGFTMLHDVSYTSAEYGKMNVTSANIYENAVVSSGYSIVEASVISSGHLSIFGYGSNLHLEGNSNRAGGDIKVYSGAKVDDIVVGLYGDLYALDNGLLNRAIINSGGRLYLGANDSDLSSTDPLRGLRGGIATNTVLNSYGSMRIYESGYAENTVISSGGSMTVSGGSANAVNVAAGGWLYTSSAGTAQNINIASGAIVNGYKFQKNCTCENIAYGNMDVSSAIVSGNSAVVSSGYTVKDINVDYSGYLYVYSGGRAVDTTVNRYGYLYVSGSGVAQNTVVNSYGALYVRSGVAENVTLNRYGSMYVSAGGSAVNTVINTYGYVYVSSGGTLCNTILAGGSLYISSGGVLSNVAFSGGGFRLYSGAVIKDAIFENGNTFNLASGVYASDITAKSGSIINISSGAFIDGVNLNTGAVLNVSSGGSAVISAYNGGVISAYQGAVISAVGLHVISDTVVTAENAWQLSQTTVENGGVLTVESGALIDTLSVESGGYLTLQAGSVVSGLLIESGSYVEYSEDTAIHDMTLMAGASFGGFNNKSDDAINIASVVGNVISGELKNVELAGMLTVGDGTTLNGTSGEFTLNIRGSENISISGNDFSKVQFEFTGSGQIDLSGNYWGTTDIDAIYAKLGVDSTAVRIDDVLSGNPSSNVFTIESTDLLKNSLATGKDRISVTFSSEIDNATVNTDSISFESSNGKRIEIKKISVVGNTLVITFDPINKDGNYSLKFADTICDTSGKKLTSTRYTDTGTGVGDLLRVNVSISGPAVKQIVPAGDIAGVITAFQAYFTKPVDPSTLKENVKLIAPDGSEILPSSVRMITDSIAEFTVPEQSANGKYSVFVSENVTDYAGNKLNCNGNDVNGENNDSYTGLFNLTEIDLTIRDVELNTALTPGEKTVVSWNVVNESGTALSGNWTDGIYLSTDNKWDINDKLLATFSHDNGLLAGQTLSGSAVISLAGVTEGSYYILFRSDIYNDEKAGVSDAEEAQNLVAEQVSVSLPELTCGTAENGKFAASNDFAVYKFSQQSGQAMTVCLDTLADVANMELYIGYGSAPTRENYDTKLQRITDGSLTLNAPVDTRDVYVMVYAKNISSAVNYTLTADVAPLTVSNIIQSSQDGTKDIVLTITGVNFTNETSVTLTDAAGNSYTPENIIRSGSTKLTVVLEADTFEQGEYSVVVSGETTVKTPNAVTIADAGEGKFEYSFYAPAQVGRHAVHTLYITCSNTGTAEMDAPLVFFTPTQSHADGTETMGASLTLDSKKVNAGFWVSSQPEGFSDSLSFFVSGEVAGTLQPGETVKVPITYTGWRQDDWDFGDSHINWNVSVLYAGDTTELKWSDVFADCSLSDTAKTIISEAFTADFGDTWGGYYTMVVSNMKSQSNIGNVTSVNDSSSFLDFEVMQKAGLLQPFAPTVSDCDLVLAGNSIDIELTRSYSADLISRHERGSFGYGWSCNWDIKLQIDDSGDIRVIQGGESRLYQPTYTNSYHSANTDGSVLKKNLSGYKLADIDGKVWQFDANGRLLTMTGENSERISCSYDADGLLNRLTNTATGSNIVFERNEARSITQVRSSSGSTITYTYSEDGDLLTVTDSVKGLLDSYEYYAAHEHALTKVVSDSVTTGFTYDEEGRISALTNETGTITLAYGDSGEITMTSGKESITLYYDLQGNIARIVDNVSGKQYKYTYADGAFVSGLDSAGNALTNTFTFGGMEFNTAYSGRNLNDIEFNATYNTSRNSNYFVVDGITYYKTDAKGNILGKNDTASEYYLAGYDENNKLVSYEYLENGVTTTYTLTADGGYSVTVDDPSTYFVVDGIKYYKKDMQGNVLDQSDTTTDSYTLGYDADGNRVYYGTTQNGKTASYHYDIAGNLISLTNENGTTKYTYDASGNKIGEIRPDGSSYAYDASGNVISFTGSDGKVTSYSYDANGNLASVTSDGKTTLYTYSADGEQLLGYTDERGNVYSYTYDSEGRRISETLNGKTTSYTYDANGSVATITNPADETTSYVYDANGNLTLFTDSQGNSITYTYTDDSMLVKTTYVDGTFESYTYDANGNISNWTGRAGQTATYTVNSDGYTTGITYSDGRTISVSYNADGFMTSANDINFAYDANGNLSKQSFADGRNITYTYNADGYITSYADELGHAVNYTYTVDGGYDKLTDENGALIIDYDYDEAGFLTKAAKGNGTYTLYEYNEYGEVTAIDNYTAAGVLESFTRYTYNSEGQRTAMTTQDGAWAYSYDAKNQLIAAQFTDNNGNVTQSFAYTYDAMGNRLTATENDVTTTYTYNHLNQIVSANGFTYRYDANGNLLEDEERIYTWTADNRVASEKLKSTGQLWEYGYDAMGNRVSSTTNGVTTNWTVDSSGNVLAEYVDGVWNRTYYQGNLLAGFTDKAGNEYYFNPDALGTTVSVTGAAGNAVNNYTYDPFGNTITANETIANDFEFVGGYGLMANDSGTIFVRARNYDSETGRWISPDPIGIQGGENLYAYTENNPILYIDTTGHLTIDVSASLNISIEIWKWLSFDIGVSFGVITDLSNLGFYISLSAGLSFSTPTPSKPIAANIGVYLVINTSSDSIYDIEGGEFAGIVSGYWRKWGINIDRSVTVFSWNTMDGWVWFPDVLSTVVSGGISDNKRKGVGRPRKKGFSLQLSGNATWLTNVIPFSIKQPNALEAATYCAVNNMNVIDGLDPLISGTFGSSLIDKVTTYYQQVLPKITINNDSCFDCYSNGNIRLNLQARVDAIDLFGKNIGITGTSFFKKIDNNTWVACSAGEEQKCGTTVTYGVAVIDNDACWNEDGIIITKEGEVSDEVIGVLGTDSFFISTFDITTPDFPFFPKITCAVTTQQVNLGDSATFTLIGSIESTDVAFTVTNFDWSVGGKGDDAIRSITVEAQGTEDNVEFFWFYNGQEIGRGANFHITLGVTADGMVSENRAGITLSVGSDMSGSVDPNDKTVKEGVGEKGYISAGRKLSYKLEFENDPEFATAPAQWVRVFDTLDTTKYDLDSFELQNFCIAGNYIEVGDGRDSFNQTVTLKIYDYTVTANISINLVTDEETGITQLVAEFMAIDPETGFMLMDQVNGMLPVNDAIGSGEGYINYTINAKEDLAHGTEITNTAKIYFDFNDPIDTPTTLNTVDLKKPEAAFTLSENDGIINLVFTGTDADSGIAGYNVMYSTDGVNFSDYGYSTYDKLNITGTVGTTYYFKVQAVDKVGNASAWSKVQRVKVLGTLPENLSGTANGLTWDAISGTAGYVVEYSIDNFEHLVRLESATNSISSFCLPQGSYQWRVRTLESSEWVTGENIVSSEAATPRLLNPEADGNMDVFFANASSKWGLGYAAQHTGILNGWSGTNEQVTLAGKNKLADIFEGSSDANILVMTDDTHGDALFVDDIYTALPGTVAEQQARIAKIDEIRAGNGDDIVDMTSQRFAYIGDGVRIYGGLGNDTIWANNGNNALFGDAGNDRLVGGANNDVIVGGIGNDRMHGGGGDDIFTFGNNWGNDTIEQIDGGEITFWFESGEMSNWNADTLTYSDGTNSVKVSGVSNDNITLIFGDDGSLRYDELATIGCFDDAASEKIFEDKNKGMLA